MKHETIKRLQQDISELYENMAPSQVTDIYWIYAIRKQGKYPEATERSGKWLVFVHVSEVDKLWSKIKEAVELGKLGDSAKVSTMKPSPNSSRPDMKVICVYTYDHQDEEDVRKIRDELRSLRVTQKIPYKSDSDTLARKYAHKGNRGLSKYYE